MNKVVLLAPTPPPAGGIAGWTVRMMNAVLKNNWAVEVVDEKLIGNTETFGVGDRRRISHEIKRTLGIWINLIRVLSDTDVKIVHSCIPSTTLAMAREYICACISHVRKRPFIIHFRCTTSNTTKGKFGHLLFSLLCNISDGIIVLNKASLEHVHQVSSTSATIIPNFVDASEIFERESVSPHIQKALYVGGVVESKGCLTICDVAKHFPEIEFRLVGNPEQQVADISNSIPNVILTGAKGKIEVQQEMEAADIFLFLTYFRGEGFSNALAEAMAHGLPCIASDWAANPDMIGHGGGIVVPIQDVEKTVAAIKKMDDPNIRKHCSTFNITKVKENYVSEVILEKYVDWYEKFIR